MTMRPPTFKEIKMVTKLEGNFLAFLGMFGVLTLTACAPNFVEANKGEVNEGGTQEEDGEGTEESDSGTGDTGLSEEELAVWRDATLEIRSPATGDFLPLGEAAEFEAVVLGADGEPLEFESIHWESTVGGWEADGALFENDSLEAGRHTFTARATLPDGSTLQAQVAGVLVQSEAAGTYAGNLIVDLTGEYNGTPITASCIGGALLRVDTAGETALGDSSCIISLLGFELSANHDFDFSLDGDTVGGTAALDLTFFAFDFAVDGELDDEVLTASWADLAFDLLEVAGELEVERISREVE
jgi:hypothetical protein